MEMLSTADFWIGLLKIVWINIILSGDNAVVIALAARSLPPQQQKKAVFFGSAAAVVLRILLTVVAAAIVGDSVGYEIGRHFGPRVLKLHILDSHRRRLDDARDFLARRGGTAVFLGRWVAFFRAVMPALAGTVRMPYGKFLLYNAAGGIAWGVTVVLAGYAAGASYAKVENALGPVAALVVLGLALIALFAWRIRRRRTQRNLEESRDSSG